MSFARYTPLRIAFIGGSLNSAIGYAHFNASRLDGHFKLEAGCFSRDAERNENSALVYGTYPERTYTDYQSLLLNEKGLIDAVIILNPTPDHAKIAIAALRAGYPVICEKALGTSSAECIEIAEVVRENKGFLAVVYNYSGYPMVRQLRQFIADGRLGRLQQIHIEMPQESFLCVNADPQTWRRKDYSVPTVSLDLGVHVHHLVDFLSGGLKPRSLIGEQAVYGRFPEVTDNVYCIARYEQDLRVQAWWGKTALGHRNGLRIRVFGEEASAEWYQMNPEFLFLSDNEGENYVLDRGAGQAKTAREPRYNRFKPGHPSGFIEALANLYSDIADEIRNLGHGIKARSQYVYGAEHAADGLRMMEAIDLSARNQAWISVAN